MNKTSFFVFLSLFAAIPAYGGDAEAGKTKAAVCAACHGPEGNKPLPATPRLAGQHYDYLVHSLKDYKTGERKDPIMAPMAANLSEQDMEDLAAYFSEQKGLFVKY
jgi:cytochrome c553